MSTEVMLPITVRFEDGTTEQYEDIQDLELNLEDFDSNLDIGCEVRDKLGRLVQLKITLLKIKELSLMDEV